MKEPTSTKKQTVKKDGDHKERVTQHESEPASAWIQENGHLRINTQRAGWATGEVGEVYLRRQTEAARVPEPAMPSVQHVLNDANAVRRAMAFCEENGLGIDRVDPARMASNWE